MNEQFIEHWRQVAEFDYPALQAELATSEAARERAEAILHWMLEEKSLPDRKWQMRALMMAHDYFAQSGEEKG